MSSRWNFNLQISRTEESVKKGSKDRSVKYVHQEIEPCLELFLVFQEAGQMHLMCQQYWKPICVTIPGSSAQPCDGGIHTNSPCMGWMGNTGGSEDEVPKLSRVDYMSPIISPITENRPYYSTTCSEDVSASMNQKLAKNTYLLWPYSGKEGLCPGLATAQVFADVIVRIGGFHITCICVFMGALGKYVRCSGFEEILIDSGICARGSIEKVITGKHYNRVLFGIRL